MTDYPELTEKSGPGADILADTATQVPALEALLRRLKDDRRELVNHRYTLAQQVLDHADKVIEVDNNDEEARLATVEAFRKVATTFLPYARKVLPRQVTSWDSPALRDAATAVVENPEV